MSDSGMVEKSSLPSFTKGAWEVEPWIDGQLAIVGQDDEANDGHIVASLGGPDAAANARLFLRSRDLLEALQGIMQEAHGSTKPLHEQSEWSIKARAAIARATQGA